MKNNSVETSPETHIIRGPNMLVVDSNQLTARAIVHGDGKEQVEIKKLKIAEDSRVIIHAHGNCSGGKHQLQLYSSLDFQSGLDYTSYAFQKFKQPVNVELFSCHGGYAINDITVLPKDSTLMTFVDDEHLMLICVILALEAKSVNFPQAENQFIRFASFLATNADTNRFAINVGSENHIFKSDIDTLHDYSDEGVRTWQKGQITDFVKFLNGHKAKFKDSNKAKIEQFQKLIQEDGLNRFVESFDVEGYKKILLLNSINQRKYSLLNPLLDQGEIDINYIKTKEEFLMTPLALAVVLKNLEVIDMLFSKGVIINAKDNFGYTALHRAAKNGDIEMMLKLKELGANLNAIDKHGFMALHHAAKDGNIQIMLKLKELGADLEVRDGDGYTALHLAVMERKTEAIETLINSGANIETRNKGDNIVLKDGATALFIAVWLQNKKIMQLLLDRGANINQARKDGETPLWDAAYKGHKEIVLMLLDKGAEVDKARKDGVTPLLVAARNGHKEIVQILLDKGVEFNKANKDGVTPLFIAAKNGHKEIVQLLLDRGSDFSKARKDGSTPLIVAAKNGHKEIAKLLLKKEIEASKLNEDGITLLLDAALNGDAKIVELLLEMGENVNKADGNGVTPLIAAVRNGDATIVKMLLVKGANVDRADKNDETPLIAAIQNGQAEIVQLLLVKRPNVNRVDRDGEAPLYVAARNGDIKIVELLVKAGAKTDDLVKNKSNKIISKIIVNVINQADENSSGWKLVEEMMKKVSVERRMEIATEVLKDSNQDSKAKFLGLFRNSNMSHAERLSLERAARPKGNIVK